jgi:hypothetical protein
MYATGAPTSLADFLNSLATFATSAGWTVDHNGVRSGSDYWLAVHNGACYLDYYVPVSSTTDIQLWGATGYSSGSAPSAQAGAPPAASILHPAPAGPFTAYHFFSSNSEGPYLHAILEYSSGNFLHIHGGCLNPVGGLSNLIYTAATYWSALSGSAGFAGGQDGVSWGNYTPFSAEYNGTASALNLLATIDSNTKWFTPVYTATPYRAIGAAKAGSRNIHAFARNPNTFNQLAPLIPLSIYCERHVGNIYAYVGDVWDMRWFNMANNAAKDEITIGSDTWKIFPVISKQAFGGTLAATNNYAFGFRKNA